MKTPTSAMYGIVRIDAIEAPMLRAAQLSPNGDVSRLFTTLVMIVATMIVPKTGHPRPRTRLQDRRSASRPRLPSITSAGIAHVRNVSTMKPGTISSRKPTAIARPQSRPTSTIDQKRANPYR